MNQTLPAIKSNPLPAISPRQSSLPVPPCPNHPEIDYSPGYDKSHYKGVVSNAEGRGDGGGAFRVGNGISAPRALETPDPEYSCEARAAKYQGTVVLWLIVGVDGKPRDIKINRPLGMGLDQKAIEAVSRWRFEPAMKDGKPVAVQINVEVNFRLY